ncbi:MAG: hypothetical protein R2753_12585 [Chitinophagales bacterium]
MKRFVQPTSLLLYVLTILVFLLVGMFYASLSGAAEGQGLAGGAIILGNGIVFAIIAFAAALLYTYFTNPKAIKLANKVLGVLLLLLIAIVVFRYYKLNKSETTATIEANSKTKTITYLDNQSLQLEDDDNTTPMGLGLFNPNFYENKVLYFYGQPNFEKSVSDHSPTDSIVFKPLENGGFDISYAPPWLVPDHLKLDYDILYFRMQSISWDFIEVTVNTINQQTAYVSRFQGTALYWPDFLLKINSVEFISPESEQVKVRPFDYAGDVNSPYDFMKPLLIKDEWMQVILLDDGFKETGKGWIQWKRNGELLINYSLLS